MSRLDGAGAVAYLIADNPPSLVQVNEFLDGLGTDAPDVEEENAVSRPSASYDMWENTHQIIRKRRHWAR